LKPSFLTKIGAVASPPTLEMLGYLTSGESSTPPLIANLLDGTSTINLVGDAPTEMRTFENLTPIHKLLVSHESKQPSVFAMDQCMIVLQGRRVAFGLPTSNWDLAPMLMQELLVNSVLWTTNSSNDLCTDTVSVVDTFDYTVNMADATATSIDVNWAPGGQSCVSIKQDFVMYEVMYGVSPYGEFDWTNLEGCSKDNYDNDRSCVGTGLLEQTTYKIRVREKCTLPIASGPWGYRKADGTVTDTTVNPPAPWIETDSQEVTTYASQAVVPENIKLNSCFRSQPTSFVMDCFIC
jgi:hypothetical protein